MSNYISDNNGNLYDPVTKKFVGVIDPFGKEQLITTVEVNQVTGGVKVSACEYNALTKLGVLPILSNEIGHYFAGLAVQSGSAAGRTFCLKLALPADFDAVQLVLHHHENVATTVYQASVATTETADTSTDVNRYRSIVGGVERNVLDSTSDQYGWRSVKWAGAASLTPAAAPVAQVPVVTVSDWVELSSVPRSDGGTLPLLMIRLSVTGGVSSWVQSAVAAETISAANGGFVLQGTFFSDAGGTYATAPHSNHPAVALNQTLCPIGVRIRSRKRGITLMAFGDSITQAKTTSPDKESNYTLRAAARLCAAGIPCGSVNYGIASYSTDVYWTQNKPKLSVWKPSIAIMAAWTPNYGPYSTDQITRYSIQRQAALMQDFVATCLSQGQFFALANGVPCAATIIPTASQDALRKEFVSRIAQAAGSGGLLLDWSSLLSDGATPSRIPATLQYDATHPNELGIDMQADQLVAAVKSVV